MKKFNTKILSLITFLIINSTMYIPLQLSCLLPGPLYKGPFPFKQPGNAPVIPIQTQLPSSFAAQSQESTIHPVWYSTNQKKSLNKKEMVDKYRTICNQMGATENGQIPQKTANICRVATYNVHFWQNPYENWNSAKDANSFKKMIEIIKIVNPDVLILEEVGGGAQSWKDEFYKNANQLGYAHTICGSTAHAGVDQDGDLSNCILSKYPFAKPAIRKQFTVNPDPAIAGQNPEQRCFVGAYIQLPNNKALSVYGTHLEVRPIATKDAQGQEKNYTPESARKAQLEEIISYIKANDTNSNIIIGADFNTFRKQDLQQYTIQNKTLWNILEENWATILKAMDTPVALAAFVDQKPPSFALDYLGQQGYIDSFTKSGFRSSQFTTWTGTRIDFLLVSPTWNLPVKGSYVFYNWASDHLPVIMDIGL